MKSTDKALSSRVASCLTTDQETGVCVKHGQYSVRGLAIGGRQILRGCPQCAEEDRQRRAREEVETIKRQRFSQAMTEAKIPKRYQGKYLDDYLPQNDQAKRAHAWAKRYSEGFTRACALGTSLILTGKPGTGKTHLATGIAQEVIGQGHKALYETVPDALARIKDTWRKDAQESETDALAAYVKPDLLVLDEAGVQFGTETERLLLFRMLNRRYEEVKPTILISNLPADDLRNYIGERVMDRFREGGGAVIVFDWDSYRN